MPEEPANPTNSNVLSKAYEARQFLETYSIAYTASDLLAFAEAMIRDEKGLVDPKAVIA